MGDCRWREWRGTGQPRRTDSLTLPTGTAGADRAGATAGAIDRTRSRNPRWQSHQAAGQYRITVRHPASEGRRRRRRGIIPHRIPVHEPQRLARRNRAIRVLQKRGGGDGGKTAHHPHAGHRRGQSPVHRRLRNTDESGARPARCALLLGQPENVSHANPCDFARVALRLDQTLDSDGQRRGATATNPAPDRKSTPATARGGHPV